MRGGTIEDKIAAIGLRVSRGVSSHGLSLNVDPDLSHYRGIVPCGIHEHGVTSLANLGLPVTLYDVDVALRANFERIFGATRRVELTAANNLSATANGECKPLADNKKAPVSGLDTSAR
jgi:lipoyl(octanoyl) transferase